MTTSVTLDDDLENRVQRLAQQRHCPPQVIMREAVQDYLEREEKRDAFKQEALDSWSLYQETGQHLTGQEVHDWLDKWGTEQEADIPPCHD